MNIYRISSAAAVVGCSLIVGSLAGAQQSPSAHRMLTTSDLKWDESTSLPKGAKIAVIEGPMDKATPFTARLMYPANYKIPPHMHPAMEHVTVLSGTFNMGVGETFDQSKTMALPPGGMAIMDVRTPHFGWTTEEVTIQIHGVGPWAVEYVNPADDPRKKS
jgi:hypothetical protein